jgi:CheY-like chemotaxis protein/HPt (histidine-containing phosphotransfer) domain-containing protein
MMYVLGNGAPQQVLGDITRVRQVLVNLLSNAVKFTNKGEILVSLEAEPRGSHEVALHFAVKDTGIGIDPDRQARLFSAFSQVDASTTRKYGGTGLGLAICKKLVNLMGGSIWIDSVPGKGSTFHFAFPVAKAPFVPSALDLESRQPGLVDKRVLIVDDNATSRMILSKQLDKWGIQTAAVGSAAEAIARIETDSSFDALLVDLEMREMDGLQLAQHVRDEMNRTETPVVIMAPVGRRSKLDRAYVDASVKKPFKIRHLFVALQNLVGDGFEDDGASSVGRPLDQQMGSEHPLRILIAEDNLINQKVALRLLERLGYQADVVANGMEALVALRHVQYDVVLMDVQMPEMDGLEATRQMCKLYSPDERPRIIAVTADAQESDREECLRAGMDDYLSKPVRLEQVAEALARCVPIAAAAESTEVMPAAVDPGPSAHLPEDWEIRAESRGDDPDSETADGPAEWPSEAGQSSLDEPSDELPPEESGQHDSSHSGATEEELHSSPATAFHGDISEPEESEAGRMDDAVLEGFGSAEAESATDAPAELEEDAEGALDLIGEDDPAFLSELIDSFVELTPPLIGEMRKHLAAGDRDALKSAAHKMKSSSGQVGLTKLASLCGQLQSSSSGQNADEELHDQLRTVEAEFDRIEPLLEAKKQELRGEADAGSDL